jgi:hypothetical protein
MIEQQATNDNIMRQQWLHELTSILRSPYIADHVKYLLLEIVALNVSFLKCNKLLNKSWAMVEGKVMVRCSVH